MGFAGKHLLCNSLSSEGSFGGLKLYLYPILGTSVLLRGCLSCTWVFWSVLKYVSALSAGGEKSQSLNDPIGLLPKFSHCKEAACCYGPLGGKGHRKKRSPDSPDGIIRKNHLIFFHMPGCAINQVWNTFCSFLIEHRVDLSSSKRVGHGPLFYSTGVSTSRLWLYAGNNLRLN